MYKIDLNSDLGEGTAFDAQIIPLITGANIACGFHAGGSEIMDKVKCVPQILHETGCCLEEELIGYKDTPCFAVQRYTLIQGEAVLTQAPAVYVVTDGKGQIICNGNRWDLKKGDYFFLPYAAKDQAVLRTDDRLQAVLCLPPER